MGKMEEGAWLGEEIKCEPAGVPGFHTTAQPPTAKSVPESSVEHSSGEAQWLVPVQVLWVHHRCPHDRAGFLTLGTVEILNGIVFSAGLPCVLYKVSSVSGLYPLDASYSPASPSCDNHRRLQTLPKVSWMVEGAQARLPPMENRCSKGSVISVEGKG